MEMTEQLLRQICQQNKQYRTPSLNDQLYLHFKGFTRIDNLAAYENVKSIYLEGNALSSFEGLPRLEKLKCLFAQQNVITSLQGLGNAPELHTLNINNNHLRSLKGIEACPQLGTLTAADNQLSTLEALEPVLACQELQTLDLQCNRIEDPGMLELVKQLPSLRSLYLKGNPVVSKIKQYRKAIVAALPQLAYLDDRPVDEQERRCATAWASGGLEAEREERQKYRDEQAAKDRRNFEFIANLRKQAFRRRRQLLGLPDGDTDPFLDTLSSGDDADSDSERDTAKDQQASMLEEPPELRAAREALAAYTARPGEEEPPEMARARQQLARDGGAIREGDWSTSHASEDGAIYLSSVASAQQALDEAGPALMASDKGRLAYQPVVMSAAAASYSSSAAATTEPQQAPTQPAGSGREAAASIASAAAAGGQEAARSSTSDAGAGGSVEVLRDDSWGSIDSEVGSQDNAVHPGQVALLELDGQEQQQGSTAMADSTTAMLDMDALD